MYEEFYNFNERPFQLTPDPAFYFESVTHKKALSYLGYGLNQGEGFVVITGEVGAGKSTLVAHLKNKLEDEQMSVAEVVTSALDGEEMIQVAARSFGLDVEGRDKAGALAAIENYLHDQARDGKRCLLIVDESQNLSIGALEELRMLSNFQLGSHPLLQMLLLGQPEFKKLIAQSEELEQLRQRIIAAHHLEAMQPGEIEPYVRHRLEHVGWDNNPELDNALFAKLHEATGGIPRKINQIMTRLLLLGAVEQQSVLEAGMLDAVIEEMNGDDSEIEESELLKPQPDQNLPAAQAVAQARMAAHASSAMTASSEAPASGEGHFGEKQLQAIEQAFADRDSETETMREELAALSALKIALSDRETEVAQMREEITSLRGALSERDKADEASEESLENRLQAIEMRLDDQESSLRNVLEKLIEFFEANGQREAA
jgi:putative secretion ATPase (PEP-CTERM system associated)